MSLSRKLTRMEPVGPTQAYKTFAVRSPLSTHYRRATCAEVDCADYLHGWYLKIEGTPEDLLYIAKHSGRRYRVGEVVIEVKDAEDKVVTTEIFNALIFEAGQSCFRETTHVKSLERPEFFFAGRGDHRSFSIRKAEKFDRPDHFVESFEDHLARIRRALQQG